VNDDRLLRQALDDRAAHRCDTALALESLFLALRYCVEKGLSSVRKDAIVLKGERFAEKVSASLLNGVRRESKDTEEFAQRGIPWHPSLQA
jgi:hypothetical protein